MGQHVTISGYLGGEPEQRTTSNSKAMLTFSVGSTERRQDHQGTWVDGATSWYRVIAFDRLAQNGAGSLHKGDPVIVVGDLTVNDWSGQDGQKRRDVQVKALSIGHDLNRGTAVFARTSRQATAPTEQATAQPTVDRSASWAPPMSVEAPREPQAPAGPAPVPLDDPVPF